MNEKGKDRLIRDKHNHEKNLETVNLSCRIEKAIYDELVSDAKKKGISLNSLVSSIAKYHISWLRFAEQIGFIPISKRMIGKIFKNLDKKTIEIMANELGGTPTRELFFMMYNELEFENLMQVMEINALRFGSVKHSKENGYHILNIHHGINDNFSHFLACSHQKASEELGLKLFITNSDKKMICMKIETPQ